MVTLSDKTAILENLSQELRRGTLVISVMATLRTPKYGYSLTQSLGEQGMNIEQNTLYPLLRRLEKLELLTSSWELTESRPRRYYQLSELGVEILETLIEQWRGMNQTIEQIIKSEV